MRTLLLTPFVSSACNQGEDQVTAGLNAWPDAAVEKLAEKPAMLGSVDVSILAGQDLLNYEMSRCEPGFEGDQAAFSKFLDTDLITVVPDRMHA